MTEPNQQLQNYLIRGTDPAGKSQVERVPAVNVDDAIEQLIQRGYSDVQPETDEFMRAIPGGAGADTGTMGLESIINFIVFSIRGVILLAILSLVVLIVRRFMRCPFDWIDATSVLTCLVSTLILWSIWTSQLGLSYRIQRQYVRAHFDEVLVLVNKYEKIALRGTVRESEVCDLTESRAKSLAKKSQLCEALIVVETLKQYPQISDTVSITTKH